MFFFFFFLGIVCAHSYDRAHSCNSQIDILDIQFPRDFTHINRTHATVSQEQWKYLLHLHANDGSEVGWMVDATLFAPECTRWLDRLTTTAVFSSEPSSSVLFPWVISDVHKHTDLEDQHLPASGTDFSMCTPVVSFQSFDAETYMRIESHIRTRNGLEWSLDVLVRVQKHADEKYSSKFTGPQSDGSWLVSLYQTIQSHLYVQGHLMVRNQSSSLSHIWNVQGDGVLLHQWGDDMYLHPDGSNEFGGWNRLVASFSNGMVLEVTQLFDDQGASSFAFATLVFPDKRPPVRRILKEPEDVIQASCPYTNPLGFVVYTQHKVQTSEWQLIWNTWHKDNLVMGPDVQERLIWEGFSHVEGRMGNHSVSGWGTTEYLVAPQITLPGINTSVCVEKHLEPVERT